jgi:apolipoprotein N-acyltransferase
MLSSFVKRFDHLVFKTKMRTRLSLFFSGCIYPLAFSPFDIWPLAFVSIIFLTSALIKKRTLSGFKIAYYWGLGCFSVGASWVYVSIHEFGFVPVPGAILLTFFFVAFLALFKGLYGYLVCKLLSVSSQSFIILVSPAIWLLSEVLQSVVFSGFPWLLTGYSQIDSPLSGLATWFGVYGVSWFVVAISAAVTLIFYLKNKQPVIVIFGLFCSLILLAHFTQENISNESQKLDIALVQPNIAQENKWDRRYFGEIIEILSKETVPLWGADLIVWPEGAIPAYVHQVNDIVQDLNKTAVQSDSHLIFGIPEYHPDTKISFVALKAYGKTPQSYNKQVLVPFGEYVPLQSWLRGLIQFLDLPMSGFSPALSEQKPMLFDDFSVIPAICYEIVYPGIIRDLSIHADTVNKPQLIVTVSSDAWFGDSFGPYQHMQMARMRALELGLPLVRSTNDGITAMVDAKGNIIKQLPRYFQGSLRAQLTINNIKTPYRRWGYSGIGLVLILSCLFFVLIRLKNYSKVAV